MGGYGQASLSSIRGHASPRGRPLCCHAMQIQSKALARMQSSTTKITNTDNNIQQPMSKLSMGMTDEEPTCSDAPVQTSQTSANSHLASLTEQSLSAAQEDETSQSWLHHPKHFFILSSSGKPIYSYHGDENSLAGLMALISALASVVQDQGDTLQHMLSGSTLIVFISRGPLLLVATSRLGEPILVLQRQLELMYRQVLLVVTTGLERLIQRNPAYDSRSLLQGVGSILAALIHQVSLDPAYLLASLQPLPMPAVDRLLAQQALAEAMKVCPAYYSLLMVGSHVIACDRAKQQPALEPVDVLLLANFITSNPAYRSGAGEVFCPVCLPGYNPEAFLHAHIDYLDRATGVYLVLLAGSSETFHQLSSARALAGTQLSEQGVLQRLRLRVQRANAGTLAAAGGWAGERAQAAAEAVAAAAAAAKSQSSGTVPTGSSASASALQMQSPLGDYDVGLAGHILIETLPKPAGGRFGTTPLWHFMCRFPARRQMLSSTPCPLYATLEGRQQLTCAYAQLHSLVMDCPEPARPNRVVWLASDSHAMLAVLDSEVELYLALDPLTDEALAPQVASFLRKHLMDKKVQADLVI